MASSKDRLFDTAEGEPGDFVFDERVVRVFPDMIKRSVPGYGLVVRMMGLLARRPTACRSGPAARTSWIARSKMPRSWR